MLAVLKISFVQQKLDRFCVRAGNTNSIITGITTTTTTTTKSIKNNDEK